MATKQILVCRSIKPSGNLNRGVRYDVLFGASNNSHDFRKSFFSEFLCDKFVSPAFYLNRNNRYLNRNNNRD